MLTQYNLKMPHAVYGGENAMDNITAIIKARGAKKVAMFTDKGIEGAGLVSLITGILAAVAIFFVLLLTILFANFAEIGRASCRERV